MPENDSESDGSRTPRFDVIGEQSATHLEQLSFSSEDDRAVEIAPRTMVDQSRQIVETQHNTAIDNRDQRTQTYIESQYLMTGDPTAVIRAINRNQSGITFRWKIIFFWFILSVISSVLMTISTISEGGSVSIFGFIGIVTGTFFSYTLWGLVGLLIQGIFHYQLRFREVRNIWIVWIFYPLLSLLGIALSFAWLLLRAMPYFMSAWPRF